LSAGFRPVHIFIEDHEVRRLAAWLHKASKERPRCPRQIPRLQIGTTDNESADRDGPPRALRVKMNETILLKRGQKAMSR
jgi:hypothetical protein